MNKEKVIIVGNGSSIFEKEYGDKIDSFDLVCRMNRGYFEGRKGYEKNVKIYQQQFNRVYCN